MASDVERRSRGASRFLAGLPATLHLAGRDLSASAHNLSRTGVLLDVEGPPPGAAEVEVSLRSAAGDLSLRLRARVQRVETDSPEPGSTRLGLQFRAVPADRQETLEALIARVVEGVAPASFESLSAGASEAEIRAALDKITVPHRIALASRALPREREILMHDPSPQVLEALARNPGLLKHELRTLLRNPGLLPTTLEGLARDGRFTGDEELVLAIACHPRTPFAPAERLIESLGPAGIKKAVQRPGLNPGLRTKLSRKLSRGPSYG